MYRAAIYVELCLHDIDNTIELCVNNVRMLVLMIKCEHAVCWLEAVDSTMR
jgi:hypothetical protein